MPYHCWWPFFCKPLSNSLVHPQKFVSVSFQPSEFPFQQPQKLLQPSEHLVRISTTFSLHIPTIPLLSHFCQLFYHTLSHFLPTEVCDGVTYYIAGSPVTPTSPSWMLEKVKQVWYTWLVKMNKAKTIASCLLFLFMFYFDN